MSSRNVKISDWFTIHRGKSVYTKSFGDNHPGKYPIYSASLSAPLTHCDHFDYSGPLLSFTTNGYGGSVQILDGDFSVNGDRAVLIPNEGVEIPDLHYLAHVIEQQLRPLAVGRIADKGKNEYTKVSPQSAADAEFPVLTDENGQDDFEAMSSFGDSLHRAESLRNNIVARAEQIKSTNILIEPEKFLTLSLGNSSYFSTTIGKRVLIDELVPGGDVPVYAANARKPMGFTVEPREGFSFDSPSLIWCIDGIFDWNLIPANQPFVPTDHCGRLQVHIDEIDVEYLLYFLRATRDNYGFDRVYRSKLAHIKEVVEVQIPIDEEGNFDLQRQKQIAAQYRRVEKVRENLLQRIEYINNLELNPAID